MELQPWMPISLGAAVLFFWFFKEIKSFLFWSYLWQLKNYHIGRFMAHFDTYNGKKLIMNGELFFKCFILLGLLLIFGSAVYIYPASVSSFLEQWSWVMSILIPLLFLLYIAEGFLSIIGLLRKSLVRPQRTTKMILLFPLILIPLGVFVGVWGYSFYHSYLNPTKWMVFDLVYFALAILVFDVLTPLIASLMILLFQPITVFLRNRIIRKAMKKRKALENLLVIGITGSYGKSSTKEFLREILSADYKVVATEKNENSEIGISNYILEKVKEEHEIFVCEMGAYNRGGIKLLTKIAQPKIGVLTGINNQHLATFGSQQNIVKGKFELIDALPSEGLAVLNWDNEFIRDNFKAKVNSIKCSVLEKQDVSAEEIKENENGVSFQVVFKSGESQLIETNLLGVQNIPNLLLAIAVAKKLGMEPETIAAAVKKIRGGMVAKRAGNFDVINMSYSSNFNGIISHLEYLKRWPGKKILVMPCLIELGNDGKKAHYEMGKKIGEVCDLAIITSRDYLKELKKGVVEAGMKAENILFIFDGRKILSKISATIGEDGVVLLESRVPKILIDELLK